MLVKRGSSPHTRGAPQAGDSLYKVLGIIPAYAGSTTSVDYEYLTT